MVPRKPKNNTISSKRPKSVVPSTAEIKMKCKKFPYGTGICKIGLKK